jgi:hypothetical protein
MRVVNAVKGLWYGVTKPTLIITIPITTAMAMFAVAVLFLALTDTAATLMEAEVPALVAENALLTNQKVTDTIVGGGQGQAVIKRVFTAILGGALMKHIVSTFVYALMLYLLARFLTNVAVTYTQALLSVSAASLWLILERILSTALHLLWHTNQAGLHAGVFVAPVDSPFLFMWLQRVSVLSLVHSVVCGMMICVLGKLHHRFGIVVGATSFLVVLAMFAMATVVAWILSLKL